ncbi:MAG: S8 family serine peptidase [candidate division WOR-3 bacterium]
MHKKIIMLFVLVVSVNYLFAQDYQKFEKIRLKDLPLELPAKKIEKPKQIEKLSSSLDNLYKLHLKGKEYRQFATQSNLQLIKDRVVVTVLPQFGSTIADIDEDNLRALGARIQAKAKHSMRVEIPISQLENVANKVKGIGLITEPIKPVEFAITSEGVSLMNADNWQASVYEGSGVKVAVIDGGFQSLTEAQANGDIPSSYKSYDFTGNGLETETPHGTAVTEAIFDVAPQAEFYLYKIGDVTDFENAKDSCISNGVHIVNHSMGWYNASYYDGTGIICDIANDAVSNGITWVNAAGNEAQKHYRSIFTDNDNDGYHEYASGVEINYFGPEPGTFSIIPAGTLITVFLNWDDYPYSDQDYDLYLVMWTGSNWVAVASSVGFQNGSQPPTEAIYYVAQYTAPYGVVIDEYSTTLDNDLTLFTLTLPFAYRTTSSSLLDPATADSVITVGAIGKDHYESGPQESFSSQGPTTDGRIKPDVMAPDSCNSYAYGYWQGTSLSSPHIAGVCALIKSRYPEYSNSEIRNYLYTNCSVDLGTSGKDNIYGWGKVVMPDIDTTITITSPNGGEEWQVGSSHDITWVSSGTSGNVHIEYSTDNGSSWLDIVASIPDTGAYSWTIPNTPSDSCLVRISDIDGTPSDTSDAMFRISPTYPGTIRFVTVDGSGSKDGRSWENAYNGTQIQTAINESGVTEVWIAKGTYYPTNQVGGTGERFRTFQMKNGVAIYGGFAGNETSIEQRVNYGQGQENETILSGDIGIPGDSSDNCYHVFYHPYAGLTSSAILDGVTITGGNANGNSPHDCGGGMYNNNSSPTLVNVNLIYNYATHSGGGMYNEDDSSPKLTNVMISHNRAPYGAGISNYGAYGDCNPVLMNSTISDNQGRGIYSTNSSLKLINVNICNNTSEGFYHIAGAPKLTNVLISNNSRGMYVEMCAPTLTNVTITNNKVQGYGGYGGGIYLYNARVTFNNCIIWGNKASSGGNDIAMFGETFTLNYSCFSNRIEDVFKNWGTVSVNSCINEDPLFVGSDINPVYPYSIPGNSPCVDAGSNIYCDEPYDIRGVGYPRKLDKKTGGPGKIDMGAYEFNVNTDFFITVTSPNGGEEWQVGSTQDITWSSTGTSGNNVHIEYSTDNGSTWLDIIASISNTGAYSWTIPNTPSDSCLVRISDIDGEPSDVSDGIFRILPLSAVPEELPEVYSMSVRSIVTGRKFEVRYSLPVKASVRFEIYDIKGAKIEEIIEEKQRGFYSREIDMTGRSAGLYFLKMEANGGEFTKIRKVVLINR